MEMPTGKTIQTLRRQKGLTQEQLAEAVGVTAAAVSKWETASAYPDILLLCPLARALGTTPDTLLDFRPLLSEEELKAIWEKGRVLFESGRAEEACAYCEDILLSHPGDTALKFRIASLYMRYMAALKDEAFVQKQLERSIRLFEDSTHSTDTETREAAFYTLSGLYMMNGEAGRALDAVEKLPQPDYDARMLKASILRQTGQAEEAEKLHQTCLWGYVRDAGLCLYSLSAEARARGDTEKALAALDDTDGDMAKIYGWHLLSAGIFQAPWSRTDAKRVFSCAGRTRGLGSVAPHRGRSTQRPNMGPHRNPAERFLWGKEEQGSVCSFRRKAGTKQSGLCDDARTAPATVYKCALVNKGLTACPQISAVLRPVPPPPEDGTGQSGTP